MALKDANKNKRRLTIYISSIILGIASLVAIQSFRESVTAKIDSDAKTLLGADLVIESNQPLTKAQSQLIVTLGGIPASEKSFASMMSESKTNTSRLVNVRALKGNFPFYGKIETDPQLPVSKLETSYSAFVDETAMMQMKITIGDDIKIGNRFFKVIASIKKAPGQAGIASSIAPPVYISQTNLMNTGLEATGSRIRYSHYLFFENKTPSPATLNPIEDELYTSNIRIETVAQRKTQLGKAFDYLNSFLNLVGFIALLLGCIGVASSITLYIKEKQMQIATLRCLGTRSATVFVIFFLEMFIIGIIGATIGAIIGSGIQVILPYLLKDILVIEVDFIFSQKAFFTGILIGGLASILFTLESLLSIRDIPPLLAINTSAEITSSRRFKILPRALIVVFLISFSYIQMNDWTTALLFTSSTAIIFGVLALLAFGFRDTVKRSLPHSLPYVLKQGLSNISRPNNQTTELTVSIGFGALLMTLLLLIQSNLISQLTLADKGKQPNLILFDVQKDQQKNIEKILQDNDLPTIQKVPIVSMRIEKIKNKTRLEIKKDSLIDIPSRILNKEYRVTYRDTLSNSEEIIEGKYCTDATGLTVIPISLDKILASQMGVTIGDSLIFDVQGIPLKTKVSSIRKVSWNKMQTNFTILFPKGVLESAPQTYAYVSRAENKVVSAKFQQSTIKELPNVSVIDLNTVLKTINSIVNKITLVIRFMALICIITGFIVLIGTISNSKFQRIKEVVLLRTIGATKKQIIQITLTEYFTLGILSALSGVILGIIGAYLLTTLVFDLDFTVDFSPIFVILLAITAIVTFLGYNNNRSIFKRSPLEILRKEQ